MLKKWPFKICLLGMSLFVLLSSAAPSLPPFDARAQIALQYIAKREGIPLDNLLVVQQHRREYPLLERQFIAYTIFDRAARRDFHLLVDLADNRVIEDALVIERAQAEAGLSQYGTLDPALVTRLHSAGDAELLPVGIWVGGERGRTREEVYALLARRYPQVQYALAHQRQPFDVGDAALSREVRAEYERLRQADIVARVQPLMSYLGELGVAGESHYLLPSISARLSKDAILELADYDDVQTIYLIEGTAVPELSSAVHTNHVAPVWSALGLDAVSEPTLPITVAVVETGNVAWDNSFLHHAKRLASPFGETDHATRVASEIASFHDTYRGMAPGATLLSAGSDGSQVNFYQALNWVLDQEVDLVNCSFGFQGGSSALGWLDIAFDYTARERQAIIVKSAGNVRDEYVTTPGKAWNVITVGGINDQEDADWANDVVYEVLGTNEGSAYLDPGSVNSDREKPEVVAPAQNITALGVNNVPQTRSGTSHSAAQVSGLTALLLHSSAELKAWPTAVKAILMASATHNIEGESRLSDEDGAGAIDATRAYQIAQHYLSDGTSCGEGSCWWAANTTSSYPSAGDWLYQHFYAAQGDLVRVAIAWWSEADPSQEYPTLGDDALTSNFNLYVWDPDDGLLPAGYSASWDNNYEIVEFVAPKSGVYEFGAYKSASGTTESDNQLGLAVLRIDMAQRVYLPVTLRD